MGNGKDKYLIRHHQLPITNYQLPITKNTRTKIQFDLAKAVKFLKPIDSQTTL
ncbi:MAG TPA: hypothetical protein V6D25_13395 [Leptolyngbyaceae cyanobacterium]